MGKHNKSKSSKKSSSTSAASKDPPKRRKNNRNRKPAYIKESKPRITSGGDIEVKSWQRLPSQLLHDFCQRESRIKPKFKNHSGLFSLLRGLIDNLIYHMLFLY